MPAQPEHSVTGERPSAGYSIEAITSADGLRALEEDWRRLFAECAANNYFSSWEWADCWWQAYGKSHELFVLACRDADGKLAGVAPLYKASEKRDAGLQLRTLRWIGDGSDDADGFGIVVSEISAREVIQSTLDFIAAKKEGWDLLALNSMREESSVARELVSQTRERGWAASAQRTSHLEVELPSRWDEYLRSLSAKVRQTWNRKNRRVAQDFAVRLRKSEPLQATRDLETVFMLHQKSWNAKGMQGKFADNRRKNFYRMLTEKASQSGSLDLWLLELDGVPRAARLGFRVGKTRHAMAAAMDPEFARYGVGTIVEAMVLKECIAQGVETYDFLAGEDAYKTECGVTRRRYLNLTVARPRTRAALWMTAANSISEGKEWMRSNLPRTFKMLKRTAARKP